MMRLIAMNTLCMIILILSIMAIVRFTLLILYEAAIAAYRASKRVIMHVLTNHH